MTSFLLLLSLFAQAPAGLQAQAGIVTGVIRTEEGLPLEGIRVAVTPANQPIADSLLESLGPTDSMGRYRLENVSPGRYNILIGRGNLLRYHPGVVEVARATTIQVVAGSTTAVADMVFPGKNVTGRVVDFATGAGRRIGNLVLCCYSSGQTIVSLGALSDPQAAAGVFRAQIADDGSFVFSSVPPGNYSLSTTAGPANPNIISISSALTVGENRANTGLQLQVTSGVEVQGTVLDQAGQPVTGAVQLRPSPTNSAFNMTGSPTNTTGGRFFVPGSGSSLEAIQDQLFKSAVIHSDPIGPDGRFSIKRVYPGTYVLKVNTTGVTLLEREIQVGIGGLANVSLQVPVIKVTGRVIAPDGGPLPKLNYLRLVRSAPESQTFYAFPDTTGEFSFLLVPGTYRVFAETLGPLVQSVSDGSRDIANTEFTIEGGRNQQILVTLGK